MPVDAGLPVYHSPLFHDFWDLLDNFYSTVRSIGWYLLALMASAGVWKDSPGLGVLGVEGQYLLGLGVGDITGPVVETNLMGYANLTQVGTGLHMRQRSRAFIIADASTPNNRIVFINADIAMGDSGVRRTIVSRLESRYPSIYTPTNIAFVSTHNHAGVGGYLENLLPQITSLGYVEQTAQAIISGTLLAVQRAHEGMFTGTIKVGNTTVEGGSVNRSPTAYLKNPQEERDRWEDDQERTMTVVRFEDQSGKERGLLSFFAVHGTSLYGNNTLVSTDNKGMAAHLYESFMDPSSLPGNASFVAGFTQSGVGDTSPNTLGAFCESPGQPWDGQPCDAETSTCGDRAQDCRGRGPGFRTSDFESNRMIGDIQFKAAQRVMEGKMNEVKGAVRAVHTYVDMSRYTFTLPNGTTVSTCPAAMGYSFAGGTTDGPGAFDFIQGNNSTRQNPLWEIVKGAITPIPSDEQKACQHPKPILFNTGYAHWPYEWSPSIVDVQMFRVGSFVMLILPGELTTMAGRRLREAVRAKLMSESVLGNDAYVVVAGPANVYGHYVTTREEYAVQRYEGASTIFGPFTLDAYIDKYTSLVPYLGDNATGSPASDPAPPEQTSKALSLQTGVVFDAPPIGKRFGQVLEDIRSSYRAGETVTVKFVGANPRNNLRLEGTFLTVDKQVHGQWRAVRTDAHPSTVFRWTRVSKILATSHVDISWTIEADTPPGTYRIGYFGDSKPLIGKISSFSGFSASFSVDA